MADAPRTFIPAATYDWLLPFYDVVTRLMGGEALHRALIDQTSLQPGQRVLEIGCGTGNLTTLVKRLHPEVDVVGLDPDPKALDRARRKAERQQTSIRLDQGFADAVHDPDGSYDRVLSALMLHHLDRDTKLRSLREAHRVLAAGGSLHVVDFCRPHDGSDGLLARLLHPGHDLQDDSRDAILDLMRDAGFVDPAEVAQRRTIFGRVCFYRASRAGSAPA
jgi:ubiquinone/menaquinone biosynthesis C-methylase UbiE